MVWYEEEGGPFLSVEIEIGDGPAPELDNGVLMTDICTHAHMYRQTMLVVKLLSQMKMKDFLISDMY